MDKISKIDVAESQLITAISLFFEDGDEVSIHSLANASYEILDKLCAKNNLTRGILHEGLTKFVKPEHHKEVTKKIFEPRNFFKHAANDPEIELEWNPKVNEVLLWEASAMSRRLKNENVPGEVIAYSLWFRIHHDDLWDEENQFVKILPFAKQLFEPLPKITFFKMMMEAHKEGTFTAQQNQI